MTVNFRMLMSGGMAPSVAIVMILTLALAACGEGVEAEKPVPDTFPTIPSIEHTEGNLAVAQRGVALDRYDLQVIQGIPELSAEQLNGLFGVLVLNVPFQDWPALCTPVSDATQASPANQVEMRLAEIRAAGVNIEKVAVNVDIMTPARSALHHVCFTEGAGDARFDVPEYRARLIDSFTALARNEAITHITVGLEMNRYYHLTLDEKRRTDDYSNWVITYRDIYAAIKEVNANILVGPGLSWSFFRGRTMPEMAEEYGFDAIQGIESGYLAYTRTVEPLLVNGRAPNQVRTADFLGLSFMPIVNDEPYNGDPSPEEDSELNTLLEWHHLIDVLVRVSDTETLPLVVPQMDWPEGQNKRPKKAKYLATLKRALSGFNLEWASWRRFSDLPDPAEASPCDRFTETSVPQLKHPRDYCGSGMVDQYGVVDEVDSVFTTLTTE
jgi:hypothetical protein